MPLPDGFIDSNIFTDIVKSLRSGECILFLGAMASAPSPKTSKFKYKANPPGGAELSRRLAKKFGYSKAYPKADVRNLAHVALHAEYKKGGSRPSLVSAIKELISSPKIRPSPALRMLAELPFPMIITTNYDKLFESALGGAKSRDGIPKQPVIRIYSPTGDRPSPVTLDPLEHEPVLVKLHGDILQAETIVVTEEDYITFVERMSKMDTYPLPDDVKARLNSWPVLFVGYGLRDYNLRLLLRMLRAHLHKANIPLSFSIDPYPDNLIVQIWEHGHKPMVSFLEIDLWDFVPELYRQCLGKEYVDDEPSA
jgi:hypothetical protein